MFLSGIGLGLAIAWFWLFYLQGPLLAPTCEAWGISPETLVCWVLVAMSAAYFFLARVVKIRSLRAAKPALAACCLAMSLGPLISGLLPLAGAGYARSAVAYVLAACGAAGAATFFVAWLETISAGDLRQSGVLVGLGFTLGSVITVLGQFIPYYWLLAIIALCPPVSLAIMLREAASGTAAADYPRADAVGLFPAKLIAAFCLLYFNGGILIHLIALEQSYPHIFYLSYLCYAVFCPVMGFVLYRFANIDLRLVYRLVLLLALTGFLLFSFQGGSSAVAALVLLQGASALLNMYAWLVFPYFARFSTRPAAVCAYGHFCSIAANLGGFVIVDLLSATVVDSQPSKVPAFFACVALACAIFLFPDAKETFAGWRTTPVPPPPFPAADHSHTATHEPQSIGVASPFTDLPLSAREKDVLVLLLKGRSGAYISEFLNISSNTVKTHTRNIYSKLCVSNRQELLTMFEARN